MGRPKGGTNREWSKEQKMEVLNYHFEGHSTMETLTRFKISSDQFRKWINAYQKGGIEALQNKRKPGNPLAKYSRRKELTEIERLEYENMLLRIENERLKKGYTEKDATIAKSSIQNMK
jgi:transposase-like protein